MRFRRGVDIQCADYRGRAVGELNILLLFRKRATFSQVGAAEKEIRIRMIDFNIGEFYRHVRPEENRAAAGSHFEGVCSCAVAAYAPEVERAAQNLESREPGSVACKRELGLLPRKARAVRSRRVQRGKDVAVSVLEAKRP